MRTDQAFMMGESNREKELMVFDWDKAARLIKEKQPEVASAGLRGDWDWTGGEIYSECTITMNSYTYLASTWAIPEISLDGEVIECYKMQSETSNWDSNTKWPESARKILESEGN